jgi:predicted nucleic acid-binding protein
LRSPPPSSGANVIVVDASVLCTALADDEHDGDTVRARLRGERLFAPEIIDLEVASFLRGQIRGHKINTRRAKLALDDLLLMPLQRAPHRALLPRCWELRDNLTINDAAYVALAEALEISLLTSDRRLARSRIVSCDTEVIEPR